MSAVNVTATLVNTATTAHSIFQIATGDEDAPTAKQVGSAILFNMLGGAAGKVVGLFGKRFADDFRRAGCSRNSFTAGTPVHTEAGLKPIEEIAIGDLVWATDPETGESALKPVTHLIRGEQEYELYIIEFATGEKITATEDHPFFVDDEWVNAQDLLVGNSVLILGEAEPTSIINIRKQVKTEKVFNLTVDGFHTFHVGEAGTQSVKASCSCTRIFNSGNSVTINPITSLCKSVCYFIPS